MAKKVFTTGEVARLLGVNINTVIKWFDSGALGGFRLPTSNERRITIIALRKFMSGNRFPMDLLEEDTPMRRIHARVKCNEPTMLHVSNGHDSGPYTAWLLDVSQGGARLRLPEDRSVSVPLGDFNLSMKVTGGDLAEAAWQGKVVHLQTIENDLTLGVKFAELPPAEQSRLTNFIETHYE